MSFQNNSNGIKKIAILGFGREGKSTLNFIEKTSDYKNSNVEIRDIKLSKDYLNELKNFDIIFRSPGIPYNLPEIQKAKKFGVKISSATELFFEYCPCKIIGITGTKGKSTTSTLIYKILKAANFDVYLAGNIGKPALGILPKLKRSSIVILELSSFQLQGLKYSPQISVVLDVFPDHMDSHKNFREYIESKANITKFQKKDNVVFYFENNKNTKSIAKLSKGKKNPISNLVLYKNENLKKIIKIPGSHQEKNIILATEVSRYLKIPEKTILKTILKFKGLKNRLEFVRHIKIGKNYINFYNDSASTNPHTGAAAILSFQNKIILIAGGKDKNLNYLPLSKSLKKSSIVAIVLYGENRDKIAKAIYKNKHNLYKNIKLKESVYEAYKIAAKNVKKHNTPITILFSPGSASFDQFKDYKDRGKTFKSIVKNLKL